MKNMTVGSVRRRLNYLLKDIFTNEFNIINEKFVLHFVSLQVEDYIEATDAYINVASRILHSPEGMRNINIFTNPPVLYCAAERYNTIKQMLQQKGCTTIMKVPDFDREFLRYMLIDYWKKEIVNIL